MRSATRDPRPLRKVTHSHHNGHDWAYALECGHGVIRPQVTMPARVSNTRVVLPASERARCDECVSRREESDTHA